MAKRDKRIAKIRGNPRNVRFDDLRAVLEEMGFVPRNSGGSHWIFNHEALNYGLSVPSHKPFVKPVYVGLALQAIDEVLEMEG